MVIQNAQIESTHLGTEDHGIMSIMLYLSYDEHASQGFGGYNLTQGKELSRWMKNILKITGSEKWEEVKGKYIRVQKESDMGKIIKIGHLLKDEWFDPASTNQA